MNYLKRITGTALGVAMLAGIGTVATATSASAMTTCTGVQYHNSRLAPHSYWVPDRDLSYSPNFEDGCVVILQQLLNEAYVDANLADDGYFGRRTLEWVRVFQGDFGCAGRVDGIVGKNTFSCLGWVTGNFQGS